jgi:CDK inhibitor PHO81
MLDVNLKCVGHLTVGISLVTAFSHPKLSIGGKTETYWKSTQPLQNARSPSTLITASSLSEEYVELSVHLTKDGQVVVFPDFCMSLDGIEYPVAALTYGQCKAIFSNGPQRLHNEDPKDAHEFVDLVYGSFLTLDEAIKVVNFLRKAIPESIGVSILLKYPSNRNRQTGKLICVDGNYFIDKTLETVYSNKHTRVIFASYDMRICTAINK